MQDNPVAVLAEAFAGTGPWHVKCIGRGHLRIWYTGLVDAAPGGHTRDYLDRMRARDKMPLAVYLPRGTTLQLARGTYVLHQGSACILFGDSLPEPGEFCVSAPSVLVPETDRCIVIVPGASSCSAY